MNETLLEESVDVIYRDYVVNWSSLISCSLACDQLCRQYVRQKVSQMSFGCSLLFASFVNTQADSMIPILKMLTLTFSSCAVAVVLIIVVMVEVPLLLLLVSSSCFSLVLHKSTGVRNVSIHHHHHHHQSLNREGRWGTTDDFVTSFLLFPCSPLPSGTCRTPGLSIP